MALDTFWASIPVERAYVGFNFSKHVFKPYFYKIRQYDGDGHILKNWAFQGSNDNGATWEEVDTQSNDSFCVVGFLSTFQIQLNKVKEYSSFRFIQKGESCSSEIYMRLAGIELFGELRGETVKMLCTCRKCNKSNIQLMFFVFIISK